MKCFEFRLSRVLEYRVQQADAERSRLQSLFNRVRSLLDERDLLYGQLAESRDEAVGSGAVSGTELIALSHFARHVETRTADLDRERRTVEGQIEQQRAVVVAADRRVALLEKLKSRQQTIWLSEQEKELETLAADSFMARLAASRRTASAEQRLFGKSGRLPEFGAAIDLG